MDLFGVKKTTDPDVINEIENEFQERLYICDYRVYWDLEKDAVEIGVEVLGITGKKISEDMGEEIFEIENIVLNDFDAIQIEIICLFGKRNDNEHYLNRWIQPDSL